MGEHKEVSINHTVKSASILTGDVPQPHLRLNKWPVAGEKLYCGEGHHVLTCVETIPENDEPMKARYFQYPDGSPVLPGPPPKCEVPGCTSPVVMMARASKPNG